MSKKQGELPGVETPRIAEIEEAAEAYVSVRDKRMAMTTKEVAVKLNLIQVVLAHEAELEANGEGQKVYRFEDQLVILKPGKAGVKVKHASDDDDDDDDD